MKALITTILTNENEANFNNWLYEIISNNVPKRIMIWDIRRINKFNDSIHKMTKKYSDIFLVIGGDGTSVQNIKGALASMIETAKSYHVWMYCDLSIKIDSTLVAELTSRATEGPVVASQLSSTNGLSYPSVLITAKGIYNFINTFITGNDINHIQKEYPVIPDICFAVPGEVCRNISSTNVEDDRVNMYLYFVFARFGFEFKVDPTISIVVD